MNVTPTLQLRPGERQAGSVTVRHVAGRQAAAARPGPGGSSALEKDICNCLCCGKIYFTRQDKADVLQFLGKLPAHQWCGSHESGPSQVNQLLMISHAQEVFICSLHTQNLTPQRSIISKQPFSSRPKRACIAYACIEVLLPGSSCRAGRALHLLWSAGVSDFQWSERVTAFSQPTLCIFSGCIWTRQAPSHSDSALYNYTPGS